MGGSTDEFPSLRIKGLYVVDTAGNGNCLFHALSDQIYGDQSSHAAIRASVIEHIRENAERYKSFINVNPGGGVRRNPKRKTAGAFASPVEFWPPTPEEIDRVFESHLQQMAQGGTYGDNMEIQAFSEKFGVDVKIWQRNLAYMISGNQEQGAADRPIAHIAYHTYEHYSSVRNIEGPHTGLPEVQEKDSGEKPVKSSLVAQWMINAVQKSLPFLTNTDTIRKTLEECKGNLDDAVCKLLDAEDRGSIPSTQESSPAEPDRDSADDKDEEYCAPKKKQDRRLSRATRIAMKAKEEQCKKVSNIDTMTEDDLRSPSDNDDWQDDPSYKFSDSASTSASDRSSKPLPSSGPRIKLSQPKPESEKDAQLSSPNPSYSNGNFAFIGTSQQRKVGPKHKRLARREKRNVKKAVKERKQVGADANVANSKATAFAIISEKGKESSPAIESSIKTLHI